MTGWRVLDGPMGTELAARGVPTPLPGWSAHALETPAGCDAVRAVHRDYALAGARVHTTNTFRTRRRTFPDRWAELAARAVAIAREIADEQGAAWVAGSIAPLMDCYRPDLSPPAAECRAEHGELARLLAPGCDILLCETFPHPGELALAVEEAAATGRPVWAALTAGPDPLAPLLTPAAVVAGARRAVEAGASAVLVNCVPAPATLPYVQALADAQLGVPFGAYANAGSPDDAIGWRPAPLGPARYADMAAAWRAAGATLVGGCCGTGPDHVRALAALAAPATT